MRPNMKSRRDRSFGQFTLTAIIAAASMAFGGSAQSTAAPPALSAAQIVDRNTDARGGIKAWNAITSLIMAGRMDIGRIRPAVDLNALDPTPRGRHPRPRPQLPKTAAAPEGKVVQAPFVMQLKRGRKMRLEVEFNGQKAVQVYDGAVGKKLRPFLGRNEIEDYTKEEARQAELTQDLDGLLIGYAAKGSRIELAGTDKVENRDAYHLKVTLKSGAVRHVWVDAESFLEVKLDGSRRIDGRERPVYTFLRDYRMVDNVKLPFVMETRTDGVRDAQAIYIDKVTLNTPLSDGVFTSP